ncbi:hypothetical protein BJY52DRAFT_1176285 [Lactarius psammicola]|nr:hypothetical protein BJY52DRAFT_1176285 [Lactarius psammicola]
MLERNQHNRVDPMDGPVTGDYSVTSPGEKFQEKSSSVYDPRAFFDIYWRSVQVEDEKMANKWKAGANDTLTFSGLFSAVVAAFLAISVQDLKPDPQDKPAFYLDNIYKHLADSNIIHVPTIHTMSNPFTFSPPKSAVWVNSLWSLSLVITLSCGFLAILLQQWARRYIMLTDPSRSSSRNPHEQARMREFFFKGAEESLQWVVNAILVLLHVSIVLFFAGLIIFSFNSNHTVFKVVASWAGLCTLIYSLRWSGSYTMAHYMSPSEFSAVSRRSTALAARRIIIKDRFFVV